MKHEAGKDGVQMAMFDFGGITKIKDGADLVDDLGTEVVAKLDNVADEVIESVGNSVDDIAGKNINKALKEGNSDGIPIDDAVIENSAIDVAATSATKGRKLTWPELKAL